MRKDTKRFTMLAMLSASAIVLSLLESAYIGPIFLTLRIGLANIAALLALKLLGTREMVIVNVMRVVISSLLRGVIFGSTFWISAGGVLLSSFVLLLCEKLKTSIMFQSICSSLAHTTGQVLVVCLFYTQAGMLATLPFLLVGSVFTGLGIGVVSDMVLKRIRPLKR